MEKTFKDNLQWKFYSYKGKRSLYTRLIFEMYCKHPEKVNSLSLTVNRMHIKASNLSLTTST